MLKLIAGLIAGLMLMSAAHAAGIKLSPVSLSLSAKASRAVITITNGGSEPLVMQVEGMSWLPVDGPADQYTPTRDLLINPPLFTVPPGRSQVLRVGLRRPPAGDREQTYRLFLREVPPPPKASAEGERVGIRILQEHRLPVYVLPAKVVRAQQWQGRRTTDGAIEVTALNTGNVHQVVAGLTLRAVGAAADAPTLAVAQASTAIFPGQSRSWTLRPPPEVSASRYALEVTTERGTQHVVLDLGGQ